MRNLRFEAETIQICIYCDVILQILKKHQELSVNKVIVFSYLIKKDKFIPNNIYGANSTQDLIYKGISLISGDYIEFCNNIEFIIKAIHILKTNNLVILDNNMLHSIPEVKVGKEVYEESLFIEKVIESRKKITDRQFMKEVIHNV